MSLKVCPECQAYLQLCVCENLSKKQDSPLASIELEKRSQIQSGEYRAEDWDE